MEFSEKDILFLKKLSKYGHGHVGQTTLQHELEGEGINAEDFIKIKRKLLFSGVIGIVYGNITIEKKEALKSI
jgi:hypothetical protein